MNDLIILREFIRETIILSESRRETGKPWRGEVSIEQEKELEKADGNKRIKRGGGIGHTADLATHQFDSKVSQIRKFPEYETIDDFVEYKVDEEEDSFTTQDLLALALNVDYTERGIENVTSPPGDVVKRVKAALTDEWGFKFRPREPTKHFRGAMSNAHGASVWANQGGGGSGFSSGGLGHGGGPGVVGGGGKWNSSDSRNLPMGPRRKK